MTIKKIENINFYNNPKFCEAHYNQLSIDKKVMSFLKSYLYFFSFAIDKVSSYFRNVDQEMSKYIQPPSDSQVFKKRLIVCLHGLNSHPYQFKQVLKDIEKNDLSDTMIFAPKIIQRGNAKLDDMIAPIFEEIQQWAKTNESYELVLLGTSNGGRIAKAIEAKVTATKENKGNIKKIHLISIVGACNGSYMADIAKKVGLSFLVSKAIAEEMPTDSLKIKQIHQDWLNGFKTSPEIKREYTFIASPHDLHVPNKSSTLMKIPKIEGIVKRYAIVDGHGHMSIVNAVSKAISKLIFNEKLLPLNCSSKIKSPKKFDSKL